MTVQSISSYLRHRIAVLEERNQRRRQALIDTVKAVEDIIERDDREIANLKAQLNREVSTK